MGRERGIPGCGGEEIFWGVGNGRGAREIFYCGDGESIPELGGGGLELFWGVEGERYPRVERGRVVLGWGGAKVL